MALKSGASANAKYADGVAVFTMGEAGLMVEASVGGQKFSFEPTRRSGAAAGYVLLGHEPLLRTVTVSACPGGGVCCAGDGIRRPSGNLLNKVREGLFTIAA